MSRTHAPRDAGGPAPGRRAALRRLAAAFALAAGGPALAAGGADGEGVQLGPPPSAPGMMPAAELEARAADFYRKRLDEARAAGVLAPEDDPQRLRLAYIARRLAAFAPAWNPRAAQWRWEIELLRTPQVNADCLPGGKITVQEGLLRRLAPTDDELALVIGHEMGHALREHARARLGRRDATDWLVRFVAQVFGWDRFERSVADVGGALVSLKFNRDEETEADLVGLELAARAGYDPAFGIEFWRKMSTDLPGGPPELLSDHPSSPERLRVLSRNVARVRGLYDRAPRPDRRFDPVPGG